jgi:hypothetical protein
MRPNETEPVSLSVAVGGLLSTGVALVAVLWPQRLTPEIQVAIIAFGNAVILTASIYFARKGSTPIAAPVLTEGTAVTTPEGEAAQVVINPVPADAE